MKRIIAVVMLVMVAAVFSTGMCFAGSGELKIKEVYPKDKATGTSVDNLSVKIWFDRDVMPKDSKIRKANEKAITLTDEKGKEISLTVKYNPDKDKKGEVIALADAVSATSGDKKSKKAKIQSDTEYTFKIDKSFKAADGSTLANDKTVSFTTVNQSQTTMIQMGMMGLMVVIMVVASMRATKKQQEREQEAKGARKKEAVNPYKEAKKTGKSVEEIVQKDKQKKAKQKAAEEKKQAKAEKQRQKIEEQISKKYDDLVPEKDVKHVSGPRPISAAGSTYVAFTAKKAAEEKKTASTNPKKSGKQKNQKK